jgi:hypothetical protein
MGFIKVVLAVWLALVLADAFTSSRIFEEQVRPVQNDRGFCFSIEGFDK